MQCAVGLPTEWQEHYDESSQRTYYHNTRTRTTTWTKPQVSADLPPPATAAPTLAPGEYDMDTVSPLNTYESSYSNSNSSHPGTRQHHFLSDASTASVDNLLPSQGHLLQLLMLLRSIDVVDVMWCDCRLRCVCWWPSGCGLEQLGAQWHLHYVSGD